MHLLMFTVHDVCSGVYDRPFCARSEDEAIRSFSDVACDAAHPIGKHPEHFSLFQVGAFEDSVGQLDAGAPRFVVKALDLVVRSRKVDPEKLADLDASVADTYVGPNGGDSHAS